MPVRRPHPRLLLGGQLATERRAFSAESWHWPELEGVEPLDLELTAWPPDETARAFAQRYAELDAKR